MSPIRIKYYAKMAIHGAFVLPAWPHITRPSLSVFTYHSFCEDSRAPSDFPSLPVSMFERQIRVLERRYRLVSLSDGIHGLDEAGDERPMAAITFDDGFVDNYHVAWPILSRNRVPATVFLATDFVDRQRAPWPTRLWDIVNAIGARQVKRLAFDVGAMYSCHQEALRVLPAEARFEELERLIAEYRLDRLPVRQAMSWNQIREMNAAGIEFGSHTVFHGLLPYLSESEVASEVAESKRRIEEQLQTRCQFFAYPNGDHDSIANAKIKNLGYRAALTQDFGVNTQTTDVLGMKRIEVPFHDPLSSFTYRARSALTSI